MLGLDTAGSLAAVLGHKWEDLWACSDHQCLSWGGKDQPVQDGVGPAMSDCLPKIIRSPFYQHRPGPGGWERSELQGPQKVYLLETQAGQSRGAAFQNRFCSSSNRSEPTNGASLQESAPWVPTPGEHPHTADGEKASVVVILVFPHHSNE